MSAPIQENSMHRVLVSILALALCGWFLSCASKARPDERKGSRSSIEGSQLLEVTLSDFANDAASGKFSGVDSNGISFDPISFERVEHGQSKTETSFTLKGKPAHPKPTRIDFTGSAGEAQYTGTALATQGHFLLAVEAAFRNATTLEMIARNDDGTLAVVRLSP
jgi:hypothetical protein